METKKLLSEDIIIYLKQNFVNNPFGFVLFAGKNGRGKTYAALEIYHLLTPHRLPFHSHEDAWFITQAELNLIWEDVNHKALLDELSNSKFLVLDDIGTRAPSVAFMDFLYALVDRRYHDRRQKGTLITTNLTSVSLREQFGDAFFSRVASGQNYVFLGEDRRFENLGF